MGSASPALDLPRGTIFAERYRIEELLGRGGMGAVYRAADLYLAEDVALKLLLVELEQNPSLALRFRQEVKLSRRVNHPNVIRVHDIGEHEGLLYMTMELIRGKTLRGLLNQHRSGLPLAEAAWIARAIGQGLATAHAAAIVHRDIKPSNVLIDEGGRVVLTDFGIARSLNEDLGLTHGLLGTMSYMAPEQATNGTIDARTDVYALGLVFYEMLVGERPAGSPAEVAARLERLSDRVPSELARLILRCLSLDPAGRPSGATEVIEAIEKAKAADDLEGAPTIAHATAAPKSLTLITAEPTQTPQNKLAVLPFRYRGPKEQSYLGDVLTDELVDALSRTRGLFVLGSGATSRFHEARDPIVIGRELRVQAVIDGSMQAAGDRVRVSVRLLEAETGVQRWVQQHEGSLSGIFEFQESTVRRVAEELRVELHTMAHSRTTPTEALDRYLEARRELRTHDFRSSERAFDLLGAVISLSSAFAPAVAARAIAATRAYFLNFEIEDRDWGELALESVKRALREAPEIAESHLASATLETQRGDYKSAATALARALEIAPTCALAQEYLGSLQAEAGHLHKGLERLKLSTELEPSRVPAWGELARAHALLGDYAAFEATLAVLDSIGTPVANAFALGYRLRVATWHSDREKIRQLSTRVDAVRDAPIGETLAVYAQAVMGEIDAADFAYHHADTFATAKSPRMRSLGFQLAAEVFAFGGHVELALQQIKAAANTVLVDVAWLDRCPLFVDFREMPEYLEARRLVRARASAIWVA